jgi:hypothetical protein
VCVCVCVFYDKHQHKQKKKSIDKDSSMYTTCNLYKKIFPTCILIKQYFYV